MTPFLAVLRVVNVLPHVHVTVVSTYSGWISGFTGLLLSSWAAGSSAAADVNRNLEPVCQTCNASRRPQLPGLDRARRAAASGVDAARLRCRHRRLELTEEVLARDDVAAGEASNEGPDLVT